MGADLAKLKRRYEELKSARSIWENHWEEIAKLMSPRQVGFTGAATPGDKRNATIYDNTGIMSLNLLASGLHGMATNPASAWFGLGMADDRLNEDNDTKLWLAKTKRDMHAQMYSPGTNLTTALNEVYLDAGAFGTGIMFIGERMNGGLMFQTRPLAECMIAENGEGAVDTVHRKTKMSARQVAQMWPDTVSDRVRKMANEKPDQKVEIAHCVAPRRDYDPEKRDSKNMPFESVYFEVETSTLLEENGFPEFPYAVLRWSKNSGEEYGRGPGMDALPDVKMLQEMMKTTLKAAQKIVDPPLLVPDDGLVGPIRTVPGGLNYYRGDREISPLQTGANIPLSLEMMDNIRQRVRNTFYVDMLQFTTDVQMTATEVMQRTQERLRLLGPVVGRLEAELLGPMITRVFGILSRKRMIDPAPQPIQGKEFTVKFISPIAMAQRQNEANSLAQAFQYAAPIMQVDPKALSSLKTEKVWPWLADKFGLDPELTASKEELQAMAEASAQQAQAQQMVAAAQPLADAINKGAGAVDKIASAQQKGADLSAFGG